MLSKIPQEHITEESLLCAERRWVDTNLPNRELLDATSHVLVVLSRLLEDPHDFISTVLPSTACEAIQNLRELRAKLPADAANAEDSRKIWVRAENLETIKYSLSNELFGRENVDSWKTADINRYGPRPELPENLDVETLEGAVLMYQEAAKRILLRDRYLLPFIFALENDKRTVVLFGLKMEDRVGKHIAIRRTASVLAKMQIDWAILINEAWYAQVKPGGVLPRHAIEAANREEIIAIAGVSSDGIFCNRSIKFRRRGKEIIFGDEWSDSHPANIMLPIKKAIARRLE